MLKIEDYELEIIECEQGTDEWHACRAGIPTASKFATVMAKGRDGGASKTRRDYIYALAAERITGKVVQTWEGNEHTERGHALEGEAHDLYEYIRDMSATKVGFMRRGPVGCSPDRLVGDDGLLEIKTKAPHLQIALLDAGTLPSEHRAQVQGQLWISGRQWLDFMSYWPGLPPFICRVERDPIYMVELAKKTGEFLADLDALTARIRTMQEAA